MQKATNKLKFFLYARKSSESEDRQIQSIDDQVERLRTLARQLDIKIIDVFTEAKSAKKPNNRPVFDKMIEKIEKCEADGILCWQINRLSRNPVDSGKIQWLLQQGILKSIQTYDRQYLPEDNALIFAVETGTANQFILDLSKNVKRGINRKLQNGWRPGTAPAGYLNELSSHTITKDPERFNLIRKSWDLMLTGNYTVPQVLNKLNNEWGYQTVKKKRTGNRQMAMSGLYKIFTNLFYAGIIVHKGEHYQGKHDSMITIEEYDRVQIILGRKGKPRPKKHNFPFTGIIRCGECGCFHTAETKRKFIKSTGEIKEYTYYHCTRKKRDVQCSQRKVITQENLELAIEEEIKKYVIIPQFLDWALEVIESKKKEANEDISKIYQMQQEALLKSQKELTNLTQMRYRDLIDDEEFIKARDLLKTQIIHLEEKIRQMENSSERYLELSRDTFNFTAYALNEFLKRNVESQKEILNGLGSNQTIKDGKLFIEAHEWFHRIQNGYVPLNDIFTRLELNKKPLNKVKSEQLSSLITQWHGRQESNPH